MPAPQRNEEVLKLRCMTKSLKNDWKQLSFSPQLMSQLMSLLQMMGAGIITEQCCTSQKMFLDEVLSDCLWCLCVGESRRAPLLPSGRRGAAWLWHFTLAQQSRPVTVCRLYRQLLPYTLAPVVCSIMNIQMVWK